VRARQRRFGRETGVVVQFEEFISHPSRLFGCVNKKIAHGSEAHQAHLSF